MWCVLIRFSTIIYSLLLTHSTLFGLSCLSAIEYGEPSLFQTSWGPQPSRRSIKGTTSKLYSAPPHLHSRQKMDGEQVKLYERAGKLSRQFQELFKIVNDQPSPDRPWFFHPFGYWIDLGYNGERPEYDPPPLGSISLRTAAFSQRIGILARTTRAWMDEKKMVSS
jgi:hypothetical protein